MPIGNRKHLLIFWPCTYVKRQLMGTFNFFHDERGRHCVFLLIKWSNLSGAFKRSDLCVKCFLQLLCRTSQHIFAIDNRDHLLLTFLGNCKVYFGGSLLRVPLTLLQHFAFPLLFIGEELHFAYLQGYFAKLDSHTRSTFRRWPKTSRRTGDRIRGWLFSASSWTSTLSHTFHGLCFWRMRELNTTSWREVINKSCSASTIRIATSFSVFLDLDTRKCPQVFGLRTLPAVLIGIYTDSAVGGRVQAVPFIYIELYTHQCGNQIHRWHECGVIRKRTWSWTALVWTFSWQT